MTKANKNKFIIMVGLPASGKSTHAKNIATLEGASIIESDVIRKEIFGNTQNDETNKKLFAYIHDLIIGTLNVGKSVVFDATNLNYKHRMSIIQIVKKTHPKTIIVCHVMATDIDECIARNSKRDRVVPDNVIYRMRENFTFPQYYEGFDEIYLSYSYNGDKYVNDKFIERAIHFDQQNAHHTKTLWGHTLEVVTRIMESKSHELYLSAFYHDVGKLYTKTFRDSRGNPSEYAHYYNHANVSAYEAIFYMLATGIPVETIIEVCGIIQNHMRPYDLSTDKSKEKLIGLVGEKTYNNLIALNNADRGGK